MLKYVLTNAIILISLCTTTFSAFGYDVKKYEKDYGTVYRIQMHQDEVAIVRESDYSIVINKINDFRCPEGMQCFWTGPFVMNGIFVSSNENPFSLTYDNEPLNMFESFGYTTSIINVIKQKNFFWIYLKVSH